MTKKAQTILANVLDLPEDERLSLASEILASVEGPGDPDWDRAWLRELDRRVRTAGKVVPSSDWADVRARILSRLARR